MTANFFYNTLKMQRLITVVRFDTLNKSRCLHFKNARVINTFRQWLEGSRISLLKQIYYTIFFLINRCQLPAASHQSGLFCYGESCYENLFEKFFYFLPFKTIYWRLYKTFDYTATSKEEDFPCLKFPF